MKKFKKLCQSTLHEIVIMPKLVQFVFALILIFFIFQMVSLYFIQVEINKAHIEYEKLK